MRHFSMKNKYSLCGLIWVWLLAIDGFGQNISKIEYFIDTDPGYGLATNIPMTPVLQREVNNLSFNIPIGVLAPGPHILCIRSRYDTGDWSTVFSKTILGNTTVVAPSIVKAEFFVNTDPGFGLGVNIPVAAGQTNINNLAFNVPIASLTAGADYLYFRTKDERGRWSEALRQQLDGFSPVVTPSITKAEFFVNTDPGFGLGTNIPVVAGQTTINNLAFNIPTASLTAAADYLYVRTKDERGRWSEALRQQLDGFTPLSSPSIVKAEFFVNIDPGLGQGTNIPVAAGQTTVSNLAFNVPTANLTAGSDYLYVRTKDERGRWSEALRQQLDGFSPVLTPSISKAEFFVNTDPGFGQGTNIPVAAGQTTVSNLAFNVPIASLTATADYLYVRTKDERGRWSEAVRQQLDGISPVQTPSIVKAEFFVNTDPGFGLGTNIPVAAGQTTVSNLAFNIPTTSLTAAADYLYVRTKDERGRWSETLRQQLDGFSQVLTPSITKAEFFVNTDPGFGLGTNIPVAAGQTTVSNLAFNVPTANLTAGADYLYVRTKDERGRWSEALRQQLDGFSQVLTPSITKAEFFVNTDPGLGLGINIPVAAGQMTISNLTFNVPIASLSAGADFLYVRTKDERGRWSETFRQQLDGFSPVLTPSITKAEFFINTDPGFGLGTNIPVAPGQTNINNLTFNVPTASLTEGTSTIASFSGTTLFLESNSDDTYLNIAGPVNKKKGIIFGSDTQGPNYASIINDTDSTLKIINGLSELRFGKNGGVAIGSFVPQATLHVDGDMALMSKYLTSGNTTHNDLTRNGVSVISIAKPINGGGVESITGIDNGVEGLFLYIYPVQGTTLNILHENANSLSQNRIITNTNATISIANSGGLTMIYDRTALRWRVISVAL
jgi:GH18 family chitinase